MLAVRPRLCSPLCLSDLVGAGHELRMPFRLAGRCMFKKVSRPSGMRFLTLQTSPFPARSTLPEGKVTLKTQFTPDESREGGGMLKLFVDGQPAGEGQVKRSLFRHGLEPFEIGRDPIISVDPAYKDEGKFEFTGQIEKITFDVK